MLMLSWRRRMILQCGRAFTQSLVKQKLHQAEELLAVVRDRRRGENDLIARGSLLFKEADRL